MFCAQIQGLYLGDYEAGLAQAEEALHLWEDTTDRLFPLLRVAQIQIVQRKLEQAMATLDLARSLSVQNVWDLGRAGFALVSAILYNALGDEAHLHQVLELAARFEQMVADKLVSRQYQMAAACEATAAHLALADYLTDNNRGQEHLSQALESSRMALSIYEQYGFVQVVECTSEEILYRHSLALKANKNRTESREFLKRAYDEMMRKHDLIPADSSFRRTYLENIALHREILNSYNATFKRARR